MQQYQFVIKANKRPETLERLLRVIRHRGFEVLSLNVENNGSEITLNVTVQSERAVELLLNQLVKLPDVVTIS
ncbi:acetolactate synthase 2 small subunit [Glaesserella parasuis]|uniref:acetolactate synthase 2 small subunit n=1 Tax=Glaesserella parasuis TaxID=738 RepID=UPI000165B43B|nr:acetolactate synthase 2 small subunit [Glaesserella parasuis]AWY45863.1 acetolactate synthase 2 small subunit [Glaesserella parasuis 29755]EQA96312.1 acetolactate synthase isozyme 2 small subunit [Glaesserella parasuis 29755]MCT8786830.1 acetolactate synthase 2 small subunit [Glaesserella parasuis]MCT8788959.1 acetolactate synthase 2 small subunit [Glaesserella parasuis]MDG6266747.1 acetolactate synthase 2 small subunit [Glaesserella parasuis]